MNNTTNMNNNNSVNTTKKSATWKRKVHIVASLPVSTQTWHIERKPTRPISEEELTKALLLIKCKFDFASYKKNYSKYYNKKEKHKDYHSICALAQEICRLISDEMAKTAITNPDFCYAFVEYIRNDVENMKNNGDEKYINNCNMVLTHLEGIEKYAAKLTSENKYEVLNAKLNIPTYFDIINTYWWWSDRVFSASVGGKKWITVDF